jgi:hypothetical protein
MGDNIKSCCTSNDPTFSELFASFKGNHRDFADMISEARETYNDMGNPTPQTK